jgi:hypothetical protein
MIVRDNAIARRQEDAVLGALISRNPNGMRLENLRRLLDELTDEEIDGAAQRLADRGLLAIADHPNTRVPDRVVRTYTLTHPTSYPIRETVTVGEVEFPRAFHGDVAGAEDLNAFIEAISEYNATVETRVRRIAEDMTRRYWVNTAVLLGLFVAVFALIAKGSETVSGSASGSAVDLLWRNTAALAPLAVVLFAFVLSLWALLRRM